MMRSIIALTFAVLTLPSWAWPLVLISLTALFQFLRSLADKRHQVELVDAPAAGERP